MSKIPLLVIQGPTGSGKTSWAIRLAEKFPLEIISADSRQVYRRMDIGTAKATVEEQASVPHHMINLIEPVETYSVSEFVTAGRQIAEDIYARGHLPCVVGGTGLYVKGLVGGLADVPQGDEALRRLLLSREEYCGQGTLFGDLHKVDPEAASGIHPNNLVKIVRALEVFQLSGKKMSELQSQHGFADKFFTTCCLAPLWSKETLHERIAQRTRWMLEEGLIEETSRLADEFGAELKSLQTLGYREVLKYISGQLSYEETRQEIELQTRRYAKRQMTWFRKEHDTIWVDSCVESDRVVELIDNLIQQ